MDFRQPDYWSTCAQLIVVLWLVIAVEARPTPEAAKDLRRRREVSELARGTIALTGIGMIIAGIWSMIGLFISVVILSGFIDETESWAFATGLAVVWSGLVAMGELIEMALRNVGFLGRTKQWTIGPSTSRDTE